MKLLTAISLFFSVIVSAHAQFLEKKENLKSFEGYFNFYYSEKDDEIYLEVKDLDTEFLYVNSLTTGVGSNDIGLDRGQLGNEAVVKFEKAGKKLLLVQPNLKYRAVTTNPLERRSVEEAFARSVLYGFEIKEEKNGSYIIDLTPFLMEDAHGVGGRLERGNHGTFKINKTKSALALNRTKAFPQNVEFEALLTLEGEAKSSTLRSVLPNSRNLTVIQHHSFVKLPDDKYQKREFDPRSGAISISYLDYSTPVFEPIEKRFITRHRLSKKDPAASVSEGVEPIIYYLDPGTPEPIRSALLDGARWWAKGFEAIGYKDAYKVEILPEDADPLDVRYNVIQWVHRSTRGWSYGASVTDPRTGEIIKGHVSLGSLRIRQDFMIAQSLMNKPFAERDDNHAELMELALARIRQLSAHEVGHTLGFAHNFAASTNENASVMDYPHPKVEIIDGEIAFKNAYDTGLGPWDMFTVKYSYGEVPGNTSEKQFLNTVLAEADAQGLQFISDYDARATGGAHGNAHLWDNSKNATEELERILKVRELAISNFSVDNIRTGEAYSVLEDVFVPLYFFHRYQTEAAVKRIGGLDYNYAVKGGNQVVVTPIEAAEQNKALQAILKTLDARTIAIPAGKLNLFPPRAFGFARSRESFKSNTGVAFDALGAPGTASDMSLALLLHPERAARLVQQNVVDKKFSGLKGMVDKLVAGTFKLEHKDAYLQEVQNVINYNTLQHMMNLAVHKDATPGVKAEMMGQISDLENWLNKNSKTNAAMHQLYLLEIKQFLEDPSAFKALPVAPPIPDGAPIGN
ncbi:zinc-dependent metalloprotease [Antarcticibacterium arcticum]|uniref:Zinc-dependent metalloprotease n=1 Tax=Antarcticibacterium arcticum TaxID=2585771 RepID=A0A5B8YM63_9FLAO|nr:zinc-dependent metalloprotease [Antarcticibacterium arcticum]QED36839.1 zinc-dependent metalloprotease [Antarcticibacterium arcticum]